MTTENQAWYRNEYLNSDEWLRLRNIRLRIDRGICFICGMNCRHHRVPIDVHHIRYGDRLNVNPVNDLRSLCRECHDLVHILYKRLGNTVSDQERWMKSVDYIRSKNRNERRLFKRGRSKFRHQEHRVNGLDKTKPKHIDWNEVVRRENFQLKHGRKPNDEEMNQNGKPRLIFGLNTVSK